MAATRRFPRKTGPEAYRAFFEAVRAARSGTEREPISMDVVVSTCSGLVRLSERLGVSLHHVGSSRNAVQLIRELSLKKYGGRVLDNSAGGFTIEGGWDDWRILPLGYEMLRGTLLVPGVMLASGRIRLKVDPSTSGADFARHLAGSLDAARFDVALMSGVAIAKRHLAGGPLAVLPRYAGQSSTQDWERASSLYVFDPWRDLMRLGVLAAAAAAAVTPLSSDETSRSPCRRKAPGR